MTALLAGCGGSAEEVATASESASATANKIRGTIRLDWNRNVGAYSALLQPTINGDTVCVINARGEAFFLRLSDGGDMRSPIFVLNDGEGGGVITGGAGCDGEVVVAAREDGLFAAHDYNGEQLWRKEGKTRFTSPPLISQGVVFISGHDGRISAYSARRGALLWRYVSPLKNLLRTPLDSAPVANDDTIWAGIDSGLVIALHRDNGRVKWNTRMATPRSSHAIANILDVTTPVVHDDLACAAAYQGHIGCMSAETGKLLWRSPLSAAKRVAIDLDAARVFAADIDGNIHAFTARQGTQLWQREDVQATSVAFVQGALFAGTQDPNPSLIALTPDGGDIIAAVPVNGAISHLRAVDETSVIGSTLSGEIFRATFVF